MTLEGSELSLGDRLRQLRGRTTLEEMATKVGVSRATIVNYESGKRMPDVDFLAAFADATSSEFLALVKVRLASSEYDSSKAIAGRLNDSAASNWSVAQPGGSGARSELAAVPLYNVRASAGAGIALEDETVVGTRSFHKSWVTERLRMRPEDLALVVVHGTSMEPTIGDGDLLMINLAENRLARDDIYLLREGEDVMVKRLQMVPGGGVRVISDNSRYPPVEIDAHSFTAGDLAIVGRVVWWAHTNG